MITYIAPFFFLATGVIANKLILKTWNPGLLVGIRMLVSGMALLSVAFYQKKLDLAQRFKKQFFYLLILAAFATFFPAILKAYALKHTYSSKVALIGSLDPFLTALYAYILWHERLNTKKWLGIILGFSGSIILVLSQSAHASQELFGSLSLAELAAFGSVCISRYGWIKVQQLLKLGSFNVKEINGFCMFFSGIYSLTSTLILTPAAFSAGINYTIGALLLYTIVGGNVIGYSLYSYLLKHHSATFVSLAGFSMPIFVYLLGWLVAGEQLYPSFIIAGLVTFIGLIIFYQEEIKNAMTQPKKI
jgi:drug/metabolite transporter (DMT)-like permease